MSKKTTPRAIDLNALNLDTARGVAALCDAITYLRRADKQAHYPDMDAVLKHLALAACKIPNEMFAIMFASSHVGMEEIAQRLYATAVAHGGQPLAAKMHHTMPASIMHDHGTAKTKKGEAA